LREIYVSRVAEGIEVHYPRPNKGVPNLNPANGKTVNTAGKL
jgi:hypothetical protein